MSEMLTTLRQYPLPDKRIKTIISPLPSQASISEKMDEKSVSIVVDQVIDSQKMESNLKILYVISRGEQINLFLFVDIMILY
jgi:pyrimidine operon attenuation protein/uracil phosphoribosyltransferase